MNILLDTHSGCDEHSVDNVGYWCFDGMDGFTLVSKRV